METGNMELFLHQSHSTVFNFPINTTFEVFQSHPSWNFVSHPAQAVVVEVYGGIQSVTLPCHYSNHIPEEPTVMWSRIDLNPNFVHKQKEKDDLKGQNQHYSRRTLMRSAALDTGDFSLTLRKPTEPDTGKYTCTISDGRELLILGDVQLLVKGSTEASSSTTCV
ncbi:unnamed protein product [Oreochromis niloticus]|nr:unnamed protein product [Mustela putorius furo]